MRTYYQFIEHHNAVDSWISMEKSNNLQTNECAVPVLMLLYACALQWSYF